MNHGHSEAHSGDNGLTAKIIRALLLDVVSGQVALIPGALLAAEVGRPPLAGSRGGPDRVLWLMTTRRDSINCGLTLVC